MWASCTLARNCLDCDHEPFFINVMSRGHYAFTLCFTRTLLITLFLAYVIHLQEELHQFRVDQDEMRLTRQQLVSFNDGIATNSDKVECESR